MNTAARSTIPTADRVHADLVACHAARRARLMGADVAECATIYAAVYAAELEG